MSGHRTAAEVWHRVAESPCELLLVDDVTRPIATLAIVLPTGCVYDPPGKEGLGFIVGQMLTRGCAGWTQARFADEIDYLGATLNVTVGRETTTVSGELLSRYLDEYQALITAMLTTPTFPADELEKLKRRTIAEIQQVVDNDAAVGQRHYIRSMFRGHPYGRPFKGTAETVTGITRDDVVAHYEQFFRRRGSSAFVALAGDATLERTAALAAGTVGALPETGIATVEIPAPAVRDRVGVVLVDKPERSQTQVFMGHPTVHAQHVDYMPLHLAQTAFGGTFTSKLTQEIREKRGWSYTAYAGLSTDRHLGTLTMRFAPAVADTLPAIQLAYDLYSELQHRGLSGDDVTFAKRYLVNSHPFSVDTPGRQLHERLMARLQGRPDDFLDTYTADIEAIDADQVNAAAAEQLRPEGLLVGVVCTATDLKDAFDGWDAVASADVHAVAHDS